MSYVENPMGHPQEQVSSDELSSDDELARALAERSFIVGAYIQDALGVDLAKFLYPTDLVRCIDAAYGNEWTHRFINPQKNIAKIVAYYKEQELVEHGTNRNALLSRYPDLIGNGNFASGEVAKALKSSRKKLTESEADTLEMECADIMAIHLLVDPSLFGRSTTSFLSSNGQLSLGHGFYYQLERPSSRVIEFGPGVSRATQLKLELTDPHRTQTIYMENHLYQARVLATTAEFYDVLEPQFIVRADGMEDASQELINVGSDEKFDVVISSAVHGAKQSEYNKAIENAYTLLTPEGVFAVQAVREAPPGAARGNQIMDHATSVFGPPVYSQRYKFLSVYGERKTNLQAIFKK